MRHTGRTLPFRGVGGATLPGSIAEIGFVPLGGVDQWVLMRGRSDANPPLILLHGGPGFSETALFRHFNAPLERDFVVVYWDQRGAGKSFDRRIPASSMTVEQFVADLDALVEVVRGRLGRRPVALFGHSWGSVLGALYAARFPEKVAAYVGSGQIGDWPAAEAASYAYALAEARRVGHEKVLRKLRAIGPPPYPARSVFTERTCLARLEGQVGVRSMWEIARMAVEGPERSLLDVPGLLRGFVWSLDVMWPEVSRLNLLQLVPALPVPTFFFLGRHDHWVPPETSVAYVEALSAPVKRLVWFEQSGHEPFADEPERFDRAMVELVRPLLEEHAAAPALPGGGSGSRA